MNMEISFFNSRLKKHLQTNAVDFQMVTQLQETLQLIRTLLNEPACVETENIDTNNLLKSFEIHRQLFCEMCNVSNMKVNDL